MSQYKGVIFDLDGTLLDSMWIWDQIDIEFLAKRGFDEVPGDYQETIATFGAEATAVYTIERFGLDEKPEDLIREWLDMASDYYVNRLSLKEGVLETVTELFERGVPMAVATSSDRELVEPCLKRTGLWPMLKTLVTVKDVGRGKQFPDIYIETAARLGCRPEECLVFEDVAEAAQTAGAAGCATVGVYEERTSEAGTLLLKKYADYYIHSFRELKGMNLI